MVGVQSFQVPLRYKSAHGGQGDGRSRWLWFRMQSLSFCSTVFAQQRRIGCGGRVSRLQQLLLPFLHPTESGEAACFKCFILFGRVGFTFSHQDADVSNCERDSMNILLEIVWSHRISMHLQNPAADVPDFFLVQW